jgi:N-acyl-D-amino-acid deacylase
MIEVYLHGTRFLENAVRKYEATTIEQAIHAFAQRPAEFIGLLDRGALRQGGCADALITDPEKVGVGPVELRRDLPTGVRRFYTPAIGFDFVIDNGMVISKDGDNSGELPGKVRRSGQDTCTREIKGCRSPSVSTTRRT